MRLLRREVHGEYMETRLIGCCCEWFTRLRPGAEVARSLRIQRSSLTSKALSVSARSIAKKRKASREQERK